MNTFDKRVHIAHLELQDHDGDCNEHGDSELDRLYARRSVYAVVAMQQLDFPYPVLHWISGGWPVQELKVWGTECEDMWEADFKDKKYSETDADYFRMCLSSPTKNNADDRERTVAHLHRVVQFLRDLGYRLCCGYKFSGRTNAIGAFYLISPMRKYLDRKAWFDGKDGEDDIENNRIHCIHPFRIMGDRSLKMMKKMYGSLKQQFSSRRSQNQATETVTARYMSSQSSCVSQSKLSIEKPLVAVGEDGSSSGVVDASAGVSTCAKLGVTVLPRYCSGSGLGRNINPGME